LGDKKYEHNFCSNIFFGKRAPVNRREGNIKMNVREIGHEDERYIELAQGCV
jgi:hypothetical protein